jgi:uncharacterized protein (DUF1330 family)
MTESSGTNEPAEAEQLNKDGLAAFTERLGDGPVLMLNLLAFKPDGGAERYAEYTAAVAPLLEGVGGRIVFAGEARPALIGGGDWDVVALVEYPTRQAFMDMITSADYQAIAHLRTEALADSALQPLDPADSLP